MKDGEADEAQRGEVGGGQASRQEPQRRGPGQAQRELREGDEADVDDPEDRPRGGEGGGGEGGIQQEEESMVHATELAP